MMSAPPSAALARHLAESVRTLRRRYRQRLACARRRFSESAVHELRIETRRLLALLDLLLTLRGGRALGKLRRMLKRRLDAFDELRDTHVCRSLLKPMRREFPETRVVLRVWRQREQRLVKRLRRKIKAMKQARLQKRLKSLERELRKGARGQGGGWSVGSAVSALNQVFAAVVGLRAGIRPRDTATIHRTRVAFKRFRYQCEWLRPLLPRITREHLDRMRAYQTLMGDIQDLEVLLAALGVIVEEEVLPSGAIRGLRVALRRRRRNMIHRFMASADELFAFNPEGLGKRPPLGTEAT